MNYIVTYELRHLAPGDYDTLCEVECVCGNIYNLQYHDTCKECGLNWKTNTTPVADEYLDCGTVAEHLERNTCPKKEGVIGDSHYELYAQQEIIVKADDEDEAQIKADKLTTLDNDINTYLKSIGVTEFDSDDFEGDSSEFRIIETDLPEEIGKMKIVHEKLYYDNE